MRKQLSQSLLSLALATLGWPLLGGLILTTAFYMVIHMGWIDHALVVRYFAGHPVEYIETGLFFVGLTAIAMTAIDVVYQFSTLARVRLPDRDEQPATVENAVRWIEQLQGLPEPQGRSHLARRLLDALHYVRRKGNASLLDDELKHLSELAVEQQQERYALVRIVVWATPMLGFLGTVIGITMALGNLSPAALVETPEAAMEGLLAGLSVAFDTTALALSLSMALMFGQFVANRLESELLSAVDRRVNAELVGRFESEPVTRTTHEPIDVEQLAAAAYQLARTTQESMAQHDRRWQTNLTELQRQWTDQMGRTVDSLHVGFARAIRDSVLDHAAVLVRSEEELQRKAEQYWNQLQHALQHNATVVQQQQVEMAQQGEVMLQVLRSTGDVIRLQDVLCQNLKLLRGRQSQVQPLVRAAARAAATPHDSEQHVRGERAA